MSILKILWLTLNVAIFVAWVFCMVSWVRRGARFPRWVHFTSLGLFLLGVAAIVVAYFTYALSMSLALTCVLLPPAAIYVGWLWLFGPWMSKKRDL